MNDFAIRQATLNDVPFLVNTIIEAEKSGTSILTYATIFGLTEADARKYIAKMLEEDIDGCEFSISGFAVAEKDGKSAGSVCAWLEGSEGIPSNILKGNLLRYTLPTSSLSRAIRFSHIVNDLHIEYKSGTIQIGLVYVTSEYRGQGLVSTLINHSINLLTNKYPESSEAFIQVFGNNLPAIKAYEKAGFRICFRKESSLPETASFMPSTSKVLMHKIL